MPEHPFAKFLRTIGKGPTLSRALSRDEAREAMGLILGNAVTPEQLGAFLLLLRYRGETAVEIAGFIDAARGMIETSHISTIPDLDWPSYADRHRQQPWFILSAVLLAQRGVNVLMHGIEGESEGHAPTRPALQAMGIPISGDIKSAIEQMKYAGLAYIGLESFLPTVNALFGLRSILGVRTLVNTFARAINPLMAPCQIQGVVHPPYRETHRDVAQLMTQPSSVVFKGGGGEAQRNPLKICRTINIQDNVCNEEDWPALRGDLSYDWRSESLDPQRLPALWNNDLSEPAAEAAVVATTAIVLRLTKRAATPADADEMAKALWANRQTVRVS